LHEIKQFKGNKYGRDKLNQVKAQGTSFQKWKEEKRNELKERYVVYILFLGR